MLRRSAFFPKPEEEEEEEELVKPDNLSFISLSVSVAEKQSAREADLQSC